MKNFVAQPNYTIPDGLHASVTFIYNNAWLDRTEIDTPLGPFDIVHRLFFPRIDWNWRAFASKYENKL